MAVSLDEIDRLIEAKRPSSAAGGISLAEIDRMIGSPPPEEQPGILGRLAGAVGRAFTAPTLTMPEGLESDLEVARSVALPPSQVDVMATVPGAPPSIIRAPNLTGQIPAPEQLPGVLRKQTKLFCINANAT